MDGFNFEKAITHLSNDEVLKDVLDRIILPKRNPSNDVYAGLIESIVSQQLSVKAASTIHNRFLNLFPDKYPHAKGLLLLHDHELRSVGLSGQKAKYVKNVAVFFLERDLFFKDWSRLSDEEIIALLTEIKGVGQWTVEMIMMFVLSREDVLPVQDLGIQQGIRQLYGITEEKKELFAKMQEIAEPWRPYRSIACLYLWAIKDLA
jgi:DNA-3-methyladenine glycosylase II